MIKNLNIGYLYLFLSISATVTSQIITKWRVSNYIVTLLPMPTEILGKVFFLFKVVFDPFIFTSCCLTFASGLLWMATMTKFDISYAYPLTMLGFVAVLVLSALILGEHFNIYKIAGCFVIILGVIIASRGM